MDATEMLVAVMVPLGFFLMIFGIVYMYKKENLAMIEKGMNPKIVENRPAPFRVLKWGMLLIGAGAGLLAAFLLDRMLGHPAYHDDNPAIYFALIAIGGGLGLYQSYRIEKKEWYDKRPA